MNDGFPGSPKLTGKLYVSNGHLRIDWGPLSDVVDLAVAPGTSMVVNENGRVGAATLGSCANPASKIAVMHVNVLDFMFASLVGPKSSPLHAVCA